MSHTDQLALLKEMIENAESSLRSSKQLLNSLLGDKAGKIDFKKMASNLSEYEAEETDSNSRVVEGVFDGQNMVGKDGNIYPIPANYASKSKLIPGDILKLTFGHDGSLIYKQIGPIERKNILGVLTMDNGKYKVVAEGKSYNVLFASITYFKGEVGDQISLIVPANVESEWGALEAVIPQTKIAIASSEPADKKPARKKHESDDGFSDLDL